MVPARTPFKSKDPGAITSRANPSEGGLFNISKAVQKARPILIFLIFILLAGEGVYFACIYYSLPKTTPSAELVLVYGGDWKRANFIAGWDGPGPPPIFLISGWNFFIPNPSILMGKRVQMENQSKTTDQNARYCAPLIIAAGVKKVVLALPWYHLPRALLLTRYYLRGSGVTVEPYATSPLPENWIFNFWFQQEYLKFWGSWIRVGLSWIGIEDWPPHFERLRWLFLFHPRNHHPGFYSPSPGGGH